MRSTAQPTPAIDPLGEQRATHSVEAAARVLGISRALAYQLVRTGEIPSLKLGRRVVPHAALAELLDVHPTPVSHAARDPEQLHLCLLSEHGEDEAVDPES